eukprot:scaffold71943_cov22-Tisochrysis_lutea.AAC.1
MHTGVPTACPQGQQQEQQQQAHHKCAVPDLPVAQNSPGAGGDVLHQAGSCPNFTVWPSVFGGYGALVLWAAWLQAQ